MIWSLVFCLLSQSEVVHFIAPSEDAKVIISYEVIAGSNSSGSVITLEFVVRPVQTDTQKFISCLLGPGKGCTYIINEAAACWVRAHNGVWIEQLFCTDYTDFSQFGDPLDGEWRCNISPIVYSSCREFDYSNDGDVDLEDFVYFQNQFSTSATN